MMKANRKNLFTGMTIILIVTCHTAFPFELSAQLNFSIPSLTAKPGDSLNIPIEMTGVSIDSNIYSIQFEVSYDPMIVNSDSVIFDNSSPVFSAWKKEFNHSEGKVSIALAGTDFVSTDMVIANLIFKVSEIAANGESSILHFENLYVNEGAPVASGQDGLINIVILGVLVRHDSSIPKSTSLEQNFPNPFNPVTTIEFSIPRSGDVSLIIYSINGQEVKRLIESEMSVGRFAVLWNASNVSSGIYFYRLTAGDFVLTRKMVLLK